MSDTPPLLCHRCTRTLEPGEGSFYVVRIEAFCDPTPPEIDEREAPADLDVHWQRLLDSMRDMKRARTHGPGVSPHHAAPVRRMLPAVDRESDAMMEDGCWR